MDISSHLVNIETQESQSTAGSKKFKARQLPIHGDQTLPQSVHREVFKRLFDSDYGKNFEDGMPPLDQIKEVYGGFKVSSRQGRISTYDPPISQNEKLRELELDKEVLSIVKALKASDKKTFSQSESSGLAKIIDRLIDFNSKAYAPISGSRYSSIFVYNIGTPQIKIFVGANVDVPNSRIRKCAEVNASEQAIKDDNLDLVFLYRDPRLDMKKKFQKSNLKDLKPEQLLPCKHCATEFVTKDFIERGGKIVIFNKKKKVLEKASQTGYLSKLHAGDLSEPDLTEVKARNGSFTYHFQVLGPKKLPAALVEKEAFANVRGDQAGLSVPASREEKLMPIADIINS